MHLCNSCKWAAMAKQPRTIILAPGITLRQERGCIICIKPIVGQMAQIDGVWRCSDFEPKRKKVKKEHIKKPPRKLALHEAARINITEI